MALGLKQRNGRTVERDEGRVAQPSATVGDNAIGEFAAGVDHRHNPDELAQGC